MNEKSHGGDDPRQFGAHAAAMVDNQPYSDRSVVLVENCGALQLAIFVDAKIVQLEPGDKRTIRVRYRNGQQDEICADLNLRLDLRRRGTLRCDRGREAENASAEENRCKDPLSFCGVMIARTWRGDHEEAFSRRGT